MLGIGATRNASSTLIESTRPMYQGLPMKPGRGFTPQIVGLTEAAKRLLWNEQIEVQRVVTTVDKYPDGFVSDSGPVSSTFMARAWVSEFCIYEGPKLPNGRDHIFSLNTYTYRGTDPRWVGAVLKSVVQNMMNVHDFGFYFLCLMDQGDNHPTAYIWTAEGMEQVVADFFRDPHGTQRRIEEFWLD